MSDSARLGAMPKVELHLHLEGSMSPSTVRSLVARHGADAEEIWPEGIPDDFSFVDFPDFVRQYIFGLALLRSSDDIADTAENPAVELARQNVRYFAVTTTAFTHFRGGMSRVVSREGLDEGRRRAAGLGVEVGYPPAQHARPFDRARALGLGAVPHAGGTAGADSVRSSIDDLGADRTGHGIAALEDPELIHRIVDEGIFLEVCPTSNALLGVVAGLDEHPLPELLAAGVRLCINTDDPGWFATDLTSELRIATDLFAIDEAEHLRLQRDALDASFAPDDVRAAVAGEMASF